MQMQNAMGCRWSPTRRLKDMVWGLSELFSDLLNFDDPLNIEAARHYEKDKHDFIRKASYYLEQYATGRRTNYHYDGY